MVILTDLIKISQILFFKAKKTHKINITFITKDPTDGNNLKESQEHEGHHSSVVIQELKEEYPSLDRQRGKQLQSGELEAFTQYTLLIRKTAIKDTATR